MLSSKKILKAEQEKENSNMKVFENIVKSISNKKILFESELSTACKNSDDTEKLEDVEGKWYDMHGNFGSSTITFFTTQISYISSYYHHVLRTWRKILPHVF